MTAEYLTTNNLKQYSEITHGFFTRNGGVSEGLYQSLNCGFGSKDQKSNVTENRNRVAQALDTPYSPPITPYQIHSPTAVIAEKPWETNEAPQADAIVTKTPGLNIAILTADCGPVLFYEPEAKVIAAAHAGWKGAIGGILEDTISKMEQLGANRNQIVVGTGPMISQQNYEVGPEFQQNFIDNSPENADFFKHFLNDKYHFDLTAYIVKRLEQANIKNIESLDLCTVQNESKLFSYRRSVHLNEPDYGRQISAIGLK